MCLAIPGKIIKKEKNRAVVDFDGVKRVVDVSLLKESAVGDYVLVHVGFAIQKIDPIVAKETYRLLYEIRKEDLEGEMKND